MAIMFEHVAHALRTQLGEDADVWSSPEGVVVLLPVGHSSPKGCWQLAVKLEKRPYVYRLRIGRAFVPRLDPFEGGEVQVAQTFFVMEGRAEKLKAQLIRQKPMRPQQSPLPGCPDFTQTIEKVWQALKVAVST